LCMWKELLMFVPCLEYYINFSFRNIIIMLLKNLGRCFASEMKQQPFFGVFQWFIVFSPITYPLLEFQVFDTVFTLVL
ncbi:hypothetical protein L9F63_017367, partial [Diploptera punctata]